WSNTTDSSTWGHGGGIYIYSGGHPIFRNVKINGNHVNSNSWNYGAGVFCSGADATFINVSVTGNSTGKNSIWYYGAGMFFENCNASLTNVLVSSNTMETGGNWYYGGGISVYYSNSPVLITMMNVTITDNKKIDGTGIYGSGISTESGDTLIITNSILWNNNPGTEISNAGLLTITNSDVRGGYTGTGNIIGNPAFVSATDFHLSASSPCLGAGTLAGAPAFDLDNNPRPLPVATNPDIGCYENSQPNSIYNLTGENVLVYNYPNPFSATTVFTISKAITEGTDYSFIVTDATGRIVKRISIISSVTFVFSREDLVNGIYFYQLLNKEKIIAGGKMIIE
ncbi:MAG: T9SS type A sorting domain-containing protein, partial [Bacteroidota bacterium]